MSCCRRKRLLLRSDAVKRFLFHQVHVRGTGIGGSGFVRLHDVAVLDFFVTDENADILLFEVREGSRNEFLRVSEDEPVELRHLRDVYLQSSGISGRGPRERQSRRVFVVRYFNPNRRSGCKLQCPGEGKARFVEGEFRVALELDGYPPAECVLRGKGQKAAESDRACGDSRLRNLEYEISFSSEVEIGRASCRERV